MWLALKLKMTFNARMFARRLAVLVLALGGCGDSGTDLTPDAGTDGSVGSLDNASDVPIDGLPHDDIVGFHNGDDLFDLPFRQPDGLGPLFIRTACSACHSDGLRGPGNVQKMAIVEADGYTPAADQSALEWGHTVRTGMIAGASVPITPPVMPNVKVTFRLGPSVLGRGYLEAIADSEILRMEAEQATRDDGIHGKAAHVIYTSELNQGIAFYPYKPGDKVIGRFGLKARIATLDDFSADAYQGDMGMTTPMRPTELPNPQSLDDDARSGPDLDQEHVDRVTFYIRRIAIPRRLGLTEKGATVFAQAKCAVCHVPALRTAADYPIPKLANIDAPVYSDLLLHDMGPALADGLTDGSASSTQWRTAPLIGLRFDRVYMHDGRAKSVTEAIMAHAGEAQVSAAAFQALSAEDRAALVQFVEAL